MSKKGDGPVHIGEAIGDLLNSFHLKSKFDEASLIGSWERLVGKPVAKRTKKVYIKDRVLFVYLESASMKQDLNLHKAQILDIFHKEFGKDAIREIIIM